MRFLRVFVLFSLLCLATPVGALPLQSADPSTASNGDILTIMPPLPFSVDERLKKNVDFWVSVYTRYDSRQVLIHDAKYIDHIYEVLDLRNSDLSLNKLERKAKKHWKDVLLSVRRKQKNPEKMNDEEKHVFEMFSDIGEPDKFTAAAGRKRMRAQMGEKDRFLEGLRESGRYLPVMEGIFKKNGLPVELTRLPFVESSFNVHARSKVGASGIWQFMRSTGRLYLKINSAIDERNDPIRATEAAAQLLRLNFESLKNWPLAVTAYNHGRKGLMRAVIRVGSDDLGEVIEEYRSRRFGFASSNFFTELLAAIEVEKSSEKYFGKIDRDPPVQSFEARLPDYIDIRDLTRFLKLDLNVIRELNPGLLPTVFDGRRLAPAGYVLRIPWDGKGSAESAQRVFMAGYDAVPAMYKLRAQREFRRTRSARAGDD